MMMHYTSPTVLRVVGLKLIAPAIVLIAVVVAIGYVTQDIEAENERKLTEIGSMLWEFDEIDTRIVTLARELNVIRTQGQRYEQVTASGFVSEQSRLRAAQLLEELGPKYALSFLGYNFDSETVSQVLGEEDTAFRLAQTTIELEIKSLTDTQLFAFVAEFTDRLDGQIQVRRMKIWRQTDISTSLLGEIAAGGEPALFQAEIQLTWNNVTVIVDEDSGDDDYGMHDDEDSGAERSQS